jgi:hypothetical protein
MRHSDRKRPILLGFGTNAKWNRVCVAIDSPCAQASMAERPIALPPAIGRGLGKGGESACAKS